MLITNIKDFVKEDNLFSCDKKLHEKILKFGLEPVLVENGIYYYIFNKKLSNIIDSIIGGEIE